MLTSIIKTPAAVDAVATRGAWETDGPKNRRFLMGTLVGAFLYFVTCAQCYPDCRDARFCVLAITDDAVFRTVAALGAVPPSVYP